MYSTWETLAAQVLAAVFVIGSYYVAERMRVKAPLLARSSTKTLVSRPFVTLPASGGEHDHA